MQNHQECRKIQDRFYELLVEPESAPAELVSQWEHHRRQCPACMAMFADLQREQQQGAARLNRVVEQLPWLMYRQLQGLYRQERIAKRRAGMLALAASLLLMLSAGFALGSFYRGDADRSQQESPVASVVNDDVDDKGKIATIIKVCQDNVPLRTDGNTSDRLVEDIFLHVQKIKHEVGTLQTMAKSFVPPGTGRHRDRQGMAPRKLMWYMRLLLMNSHNLAKLEELEAQKYPADKIQTLFSVPLQRLSVGENNKRQLTQFFRQAAPVILRVLRERNALLAKIHNAHSNTFHDKQEAATLIEKIENSTLEF